MADGNISVIIDNRTGLTAKLSPQDPKESCDVDLTFSKQWVDDHIRNRVTDIIQARLEKNGIETEYNYNDDGDFTYINGKAKYNATRCNSYVMANHAAAALREVGKLAKGGMELEQALERVYEKEQIGGASFSSGHDAGAHISGMVINPSDSAMHRLFKERHGDETHGEEPQRINHLTADNARTTIVTALRNGVLRDQVQHGLAFTIADRLSATLEKNHPARPACTGAKDPLRDTVEEALLPIENVDVRARAATAIVSALETTYARIGAGKGGKATR